MNRRTQVVDTAVEMGQLARSAPILAIMPPFAAGVAVHILRACASPAFTQSLAGTRTVARAGAMAALMLLPAANVDGPPGTTARKPCAKGFKSRTRRVSVGHAMRYAQVETP